MSFKLLDEHNLELLCLKSGLHRFIRVYTCQNATFLEKSPDTAHIYFCYFVHFLAEFVCDTEHNNMWKCSLSHKCISVNQTCDCKTDCPFGEDEENCPELECPTSKFFYCFFREPSGSVVECLTQDREAVGSSLIGFTALWSLSKTHLS